MTTAEPHSAQTRLASYGTLAPGRPNHHQLEALEGRWLKGKIRGRLIEFGWGADLGYPGLVLDAKGEAIEVMIFESYDLPAHWDRLDAFEGENYKRQICEVDSDDGPIEVMVYSVDG